MAAHDGCGAGNQHNRVPAGYFLRKQGGTRGMVALQQSGEKGVPNFKRNLSLSVQVALYKGVVVREVPAYANVVIQAVRAVAIWCFSVMFDLTPSVTYNKHPWPESITTQYMHMNVKQKHVTCHGRYHR